MEATKEYKAEKPVEIKQIEKRLRQYKSDTSKLHLIECEMKRIESEIEELDPTYISAYDYTAPRVQHTRASPVEITAVENEKKEAEANRLKNELWELARDRLMLQIKVEYTEALLECLTEEERFVIEKYYFDGLPWYAVAERYRSKYGIYKTARTMKSKRYEAVQKMCQNLPKRKSPV